MTQEQLKAFQDAIRLDENLREELQRAEDAEAIVEIAKKAGFTITVESIHTALENPKMSDGELESVAGGTFSLACTFGCGGTNYLTC